MSDTVKVIVEIPKEAYLNIKDGLLLARDTMASAEAIKNGTPLDNIKAAIKNRSYGVANDSVLRGEMYERHAVLEILDNIDKIEVRDKE